MFEPQGAGFFLLLMVVFGGLLVWVALARQLVFRVLAACLAFLPAMVFGVAAVNRYYDYYQTWGGMINDLTSQGAGNLPKYAAGGKGTNKQFDKNIGRVTSQAEDAQVGYLFQTSVTGAHSHLTRDVYVYLPPQYFQPAYRAYRFPVIELIHGEPGVPQDWITVVGVTRTFGHLLADKLAQPAVLVMPDANGGARISLQCLNQAGGPQDLTYLAVDLPAQVARMLRVSRPGPAWAVAGYSEGGFCAANMTLRYPHRYGFAGVLSGYFTPLDNQLAGTGRPVSPFGGDDRLRDENTPLDELPAAAVVPRFWLGAGAADSQDVLGAERFWHELRPRQPDAPLTLTPGGGHTMTTWRAQIPSMLTWMTPRLARAAQPLTTARPGKNSTVAVRAANG